jgi:hypothetical protein
MCSKYSLDSIYLQAKFICWFQGSRPIMSAKNKLVVADKMSFIPSSPHTGMQILTGIMSDYMIIVYKD